MSFANLKTNRTDISKLANAAAEMSGTKQSTNKYEDLRFWKPTVDESGNGYAVVRFLPAGEGQELPWVRYFDHFFKGPSGQWYVEKSLTTLNGQNDPVSEYNSRLWNSGIDEDKETARRQKRRLHYVANIMVMNDPANPANEGKVFLYDFGKKIFDKIMDKMQPEFPGETPINPFDFWSGADFQLKIRNVAGYRNYDKSEFKAEAPLLEADETKLESTYNQLHDVTEFTAPSSYKSYDELKGRLEVVLGQSTGAGSTVKNDSLTQTAESAPMRTAEPTVVSNSAPEPSITAAAGDDDTLSYFAKLAAED
jgi:hypothetical protein